MAVNLLYKSCQMQSLHGTIGPNDSGDIRRNATENEAKGKCREAQIKGKREEKDTKNKTKGSRPVVSDKTCDNLLEQ